MKETLISFETAKLAKEKGFPQNLENLKYFYVKPNSKMFGIDEEGRYYPTRNSLKNKLYKIGGSAALNLKNVIFALTQSLLQKWLREKFHIHVEVNIQNNRLDTKVKTNRIKSKINTYKTYEEALEKGLQEGLKLIK